MFTEESGRDGMRVRLLALTSAIAVGIAFVALPVVVAGATADHPMVGSYRVHTNWNGAPPTPFTMTLNADGTVSSSDGDDGTWVQQGKNVTVSFYGGDGGESGGATFLGKKTARGFNSVARPGTMSNTEGGTGTWYATYSHPAGSIGNGVTGSGVVAASGALG
jgi:hypothetical protein